MNVILTYTGPVRVHLDMDTGQVTSVHVMDDDLSLEPVVTNMSGGEVATRYRDQAISMADEADWPQWEFGY